MLICKRFMAAAVAGGLLSAGLANAGVLEDAGNVSLHLDAGTLGLMDGDSVASWGSLTQADVNKQPVYRASNAAFNGHAVVDFDGAFGHAAGDALFWSGANVSARTIFAVVNSDDGQGLRGVLSRGDDRLNVRIHDSSWYRSPGHGQDDNDFPGVAPDGGVSIGAAPLPSQANHTYAAGQVHTYAGLAGATQNYGNLLLGGSSLSGGHHETRYWNGQIAEVVVYDEALSINETWSVLNHLGTKYALRQNRGEVIAGPLGGDLTDPQNDGAPNEYVNYDAVFTTNDQAYFVQGASDEGAFNVFDNQVGGNDRKWCCNDPAENTDGYLHVTAELSSQYQLTHFTLTSSNDSPQRDPRVFSIQGSNDGETWVDIFVHDNTEISLWGQSRNQTLLFTAGVDYDLPDFFSFFRYRVDATGSTEHAMGEIEYFGTALIPTPAALPAGVALLGIMAMRRRRSSHA